MRLIKILNRLLDVYVCSTFLKNKCYHKCSTHTTLMSALLHCAFSGEAVCVDARERQIH